MKQSKNPSKAFKRIGRACDQCRVRKSKCDGKHPCKPCTENERECIYDDRVSKRRPYSAVYVADLEKENQQLKNAMFSLRENDSEKYESSLAEQESSVNNYETPYSKDDTHSVVVAGPSDRLETMITTTERLFLDERGKYRYQGHSAGFTLLGDVHEKIDQMLRDSPGAEDWASYETLKAFDQPSPLTYSLSALERTDILPSKDVALELSTNALDDGCCLMSFVHRSTFNKMLDLVYANKEGQYTVEENEFLPLLYEALALGTLLSVEKMNLQPNKNEAERRSLMYFHAGRSLLDMMACRDLFTLQAIMFMAMYLQSSARLSACHSYLTVAIASAMRMGVHSSTVSASFGIVERETRKRIIWELYTMETYVTAMLGLPKLLNQDYIHQDLPSEYEVYESTAEDTAGYSRDPDIALVASNTHTKLLLIMSKIITEIYPVAARGTGVRYQVSYRQIAETENRLAEWHKSLPYDFATNPDDPERTIQIRTQLRLRLAYAHVEMVLYRPFLHHLIRKGTEKAPDLRSYACASACIKAAMQVIWLVEQLDSQDLLTGPYWLTVYMTFFASMSLLLFALGNDRDPTASDSLLAAEKGRQILITLAPSCPMAAGSAESLMDLSKRIARASEIQISESYSFVAEFLSPKSPA